MNVTYVMCPDAPKWAYRLLFGDRYEFLLKDGSTVVGRAGDGSILMTDAGCPHIPYDRVADVLAHLSDKG